MHTVWKGAISFGLVHVPVKMHTATEDKDISLRMIHSKCGSPLSYVRECPVCDTEVAWGDIVKGYEYEPGHFVLFNKEELEALQEEASRAIAIQDFVDLTDIDPIYYQKTYYLSPDQAGTNAYQLLREALRLSNKIGIARVTLRAKSSLAAIRVIDNCLVMETMHFPDEIRASSAVPNVPAQVQVNDKELEMAKLLIQQLSAPFEPEKYTDEYRSRLLTRIEQKIAGQEVKAAPQLHQETPIVDLMAALQASLQAAQPGMQPALIATDAGVAAKGATGAAPIGTGAAMADAGIATSGAEAGAPTAKKPRRRRTAANAAENVADTAATKSPRATRSRAAAQKAAGTLDVQDALAAASAANVAAASNAALASAAVPANGEAGVAAPAAASAATRAPRRRRTQTATTASPVADGTAIAADNTGLAGTAAKPARRTRRRKSEHA